MEQDSDQIIINQTKPVENDFCQQLVRISSNDSSPQLQDHQYSHSAVESFEEQHAERKRSIIEQNQEQGHSNQDKKDETSHSILQQIQRESIIKQAERQRIGGTYDYFAFHLDKYKKHLLSRKIVLTNITSMIDKNKIIKAHPIIILKEYFKNYASICVDFHQKSYDYQFPHRVQNDNKLINLSKELKAGLDKLLNLRHKTGAQMNRLEKYMKSLVGKVDQTIQSYWKMMAEHQIKSTAKRDIFQERQKKFQKRIQKIHKVYSKGIIGEQISEDVFEEMIKFIREQKQLRLSIYDWGRQVLNLRKNIMEADCHLFSELQSILTEFKNFNNTVYQFERKKFDFLKILKQNIEKMYDFEKLCTPLDNDYIISIINFTKKYSVPHLQPQHYMKFFNQQYFGQVIGQTNQFLKGTIIKTFTLKDPDEELVRTVSGNLINYNKKTLKIKYKMKAINTTAEFQGNGCVILKEKVIGIIFDNDHFQNVYFIDDNRAEQLVLSLSGSYNRDLQ